MRKFILALVIFNIIGSIVLSGFALIHETIIDDKFDNYDKEFVVVDLANYENLLSEYDYSY